MDRDEFIDRLKTIASMTEELAYAHHLHKPSPSEYVKELRKLLDELIEVYNFEDVYIYDSDDMAFEDTRQEAEEWLDIYEEAYGY